jgi:hypothetical protein
MNLLEEYLIINNYADTEKAASKILEAASDHFLDYLLQEISQYSYDRLRARLTNARTPEERERIQQQIRDSEEAQRNTVLKSKPAIRPFLAKKVEKSRPVQAVKRFLKYTVGGGILPI